MNYITYTLLLSILFITFLSLHYPVDATIVSCGSFGCYNRRTNSCLCAAGFEGDCTTPTCLNGGVLTSVQQSDGTIQMKCSCTKGFSGDNCEVIDCGPTGYYDPYTKTCKCALGYGGQMCSDCIASSVSKDITHVCCITKTLIQDRSGRNYYSWVPLFVSTKTANLYLNGQIFASECSKPGIVIYHETLDFYNLTHTLTCDCRIQSAVIQFSEDANGVQTMIQNETEVIPFTGNYVSYMESIMKDAVLLYETTSVDPSKLYNNAAQTTSSIQKQSTGPVKNDSGKAVFAVAIPFSVIIVIIIIVVLVLKFPSLKKSKKEPKGDTERQSPQPQQQQQHHQQYQQHQYQQSHQKQQYQHHGGFSIDDFDVRAVPNVGRESSGPIVVFGSR